MHEQERKADWTGKANFCFLCDTLKCANFALIVYLFYIYNMRGDNKLVWYTMIGKSTVIND